MSVAELQALERAHVVPAYARMPVEFVRGEGARLWDSEGVEYLDFQTGLAVTSLGHSHPAVVAAIREQAARLVHVGNLFYTEQGMRLAKRLAEGSLGGKVHFANSGTEANEAALKVARKARQGGTIVSVHRGFHGRTYGSLSATPQEAKQAPFAPLVPGFVAVAPTAEAITAAVDERTAAVLLEPVQGESGVWVLDDELLRAARAACDEHGAALIYDEVQCGLGRTGTLWAYEDAGVVPDMLTSAKALGGGLPIGALICGAALRRRLRARRPRLDVRRRPGRLRGRPRRARRRRGPGAAGARAGARRAPARRAERAAGGGGGARARAHARLRPRRRRRARPRAPRAARAAPRAERHGSGDGAPAAAADDHRRRGR